MDESSNRKVVNDRIADLPTSPGDNRQQGMTAFYNLAFQPDRVDCAIATAYLGWSQAELERLFLAARKAWSGIEPNQSPLQGG
jgi:hypothetical protein